jgi:DNA polymerase-3 subunit delta'
MANLNFLDNTSKIIISNDFENTILDIKQEKIPTNYIYIYPEQNILVDDVKNIIKHSYISMEEIEYIIICIESINIQSQNALLKILEEPPLKKYYILLSHSKNIFLPTILSRLIVIKSDIPTISKIELPFDIYNIDLDTIFSYIKTNKNISKQDTLATIEAIFENIYKNNIFLQKDTLELFHSSIKLANINSKPIHILSNILLTIYHQIKK